jgi:tetratricopeptide (TPR) repeat protein
MNKFVVTILFLSVAFSLKAQDSTNVDPQGRPAIYWLFHNNYNMATRYNDFDAARNSLYSLINIDPENDSLRFNLAYLYFDERKYPSTILVCMDILAKNPQHAPALEMSGISFEELGIKDKALASYEKLFVTTENLTTLYKVIFLQYDLKRYGECNVNIDILMNDAAADDAKITLQVGDQAQKEFPLKAAALNIRGLVKKAQGDKPGAKKDFNAALELAPDFLFATENLAELEK